jgi:hypothetical protein
VVGALARLDDRPAPEEIWSTIWVGVAIVLALFVIWAIMMGWQLRPTRRLRVTRRWLSTGWFGRLPSSPTGAVAARSFSYWLRDPRYRTVFTVLPILPVLILGAFWVAGVPFQYGVLVPLPIMVLVLAWSTVHNDVAYDSTAVWTHLAAPTRGAQDRVGRMIPVLVFGVLLLGIGVPLTAWGHGDFEIVPVLLGVPAAADRRQFGRADAGIHGAGHPAGRHAGARELGTLVLGGRRLELDRPADRGGERRARTRARHPRRSGEFRPPRPGTAGLRRATLGP